MTFPVFEHGRIVPITGKSLSSVELPEVVPIVANEYGGINSMIVGGEPKMAATVFEQNVGLVTGHSLFFGKMAKSAAVITTDPAA